MANTDNKAKFYLRLESLDYLKSVSILFVKFNFFFMINPQTKQLGKFPSDYSPVGSIQTDK